jgi:hypothetical protein
VFVETGAGDAVAGDGIYDGGLLYTGYRYDTETVGLCRGTMRFTFRAQNPLRALVPESVTLQVGQFFRWIPGRWHP